MKKINAALALAFGGLLSVSHPVLAATASAELQVTATVPASCSITTAPVNFGNYDPTAQNDTLATGTVTVTCVRGTALSVALDGGKNPGANAGERAMTTSADSTAKLAYYLYKPAEGSSSCDGRETVSWGASDTDRLAITSTTISQATSYSVCGKVTQQQDVPAGTYQDMVTATVHF